VAHCEAQHVLTDGILLLQTVGHMWRRYLEILETEGHEEGAEVLAFEELGLKRYCCRRMLLTHVDLIEKLMVYNSGCPVRPPVILLLLQCACCQFLK